MLAKILGNVRFFLLCAPLAGCASDQSAIFVGVVVGFLNVCTTRDLQVIRLVASV
jgi:hypothetical protein